MKTSDLLGRLLTWHPVCSHTYIYMALSFIKNIHYIFYSLVKYHKWAYHCHLWKKLNTSTKVHTQKVSKVHWYLDIALDSLEKIMIMRYATANVQWMSLKMFMPWKNIFTVNIKKVCKCVRGILVLQNAVNVTGWCHNPYSQGYSRHAAQALLGHCISRETKFPHPLHSSHTILTDTNLRNF